MTGKQTIKPEEFSFVMKEIIAAHKEETVEKVNEAALDEAKECVRKIKNASKEKFGTGKYQRGWTKRKKKMKEGYNAYIIYNKTRYMLTHLLEYGHEKWLWGKGPCGYVEGKSHIRPVAEESSQRYYQKITEALRK